MSAASRRRAVPARLLAVAAVAAVLAGVASSPASAQEEDTDRPATVSPTAYPATDEAPPSSSISPLTQTTLTFEQALYVANRLAPDIVVPTTCVRPPLSRRWAMPNAPRAFRSGVHQGLDFGCGGVAGTARAAMDGRVVVAVGDFVSPTVEEYYALEGIANQLGYTPPYTLVMLYGNYVVIDHGIVAGLGHVVSLYAHLDSLAPEIRVGLAVSAGRTIGVIGKTGTASAAAGRTNPLEHLHWEIHINSGYLAARLSVAQTRQTYTALFSGS